MKIPGKKNNILKLPRFEVDGEVVKQDDRYVVQDNTVLKNLILSSTNLNPKKKPLAIIIRDKKKFIFLLAEQAKCSLMRIGFQ